MDSGVRAELTEALETMSDTLQKFLFSDDVEVICPRFVFELVTETDRRPHVFKVTLTRSCKAEDYFVCVDVEGDESGYWLFNERRFLTNAEDEAEWEAEELSGALGGSETHTTVCSEFKKRRI